jgi:hypothetical protein
LPQYRFYPVYTDWRPLLFPISCLPAEIPPPANQRKKGNMYENNEEKDTYSGWFARQPDHTESTVWGTKETHEQPFGADIHVTKDWLGNVTDVQSGW